MVAVPVAVEEGGRRGCTAGEEVDGVATTRPILQAKGEIWRLPMPHVSLICLRRDY